MEHKSESSLRKSFEKGVDLYCRGEYEVASECLMKIETEYERAKLILVLIEKKRTVKTGYSIELNKNLEILAKFSKTDPITIYEDGLYKLARGHYEAAVECFKKAIEAQKPGNACAQYRLGLCYAQGKGVEKDLVKAAKYFYDAAVQGHEEGTFYLGLCCLDSQQIAKIYGSWFQSVLDQENANQNAQFHMGFCHFTGKEPIPGTKFEQSYKQAAKVFLPIIGLGGHITAQYLFAMCCYCDTSLVMDPEFNEFPSLSSLHTRTDKAYFLAERYARFAAVQGHSGAQYALAMFLLEGVGGKQNFKEAYEWFGKAAAKGHQEAQYCLKRFHAENEAGFVLPAEPESPADNKVNTTIGKFRKQAHQLGEELFAEQGFLKKHLDKMFTFDSSSKPADSVASSLPPAKSISPQPKRPENKSQEPKPEVSLMSTSVVLVKAAPAKLKETLIQKQSAKENIGEVEHVNVSEPTSQVTPSPPAPPVASEKKQEPKKKKEKKLKKKTDTVNDKKSEPTPLAPPLSFSEAENLLNKAATQNLDTQKKERLTQWFETENAIKENKNANSHYCLGLYWGYIAKNPLQAFLKYTKAAELDLAHVGANYHLGLCYGENGRNFNNNKPMAKDAKKALEHYQIAADNGHERAKRAYEKLKEKVNKKREEKEAQKKEAQKKAQLASLAQEITPPVTISPSPTQEAMSDEISLAPLEIEPHAPLESPPNTPVNSQEVKFSRDKAVTPPPTQDEKPAPKDSKSSKSVLKMSRQAFDEGRKAYGLKQYVQAKAKLKEAADDKNLLACLFYGVVLKEIEPNNEEAEIYFKKVQGQSWFLEQLEKFEKIDQLDKVDAKKVFNNLFYVGLYCEFVSDGMVEKLTKEKAVGYCQKAAEEGCVEAQAYLARCYFVDRDYDNAAHWFGKAAAKKNPDAYYHLGLFHLGGAAVDVVQDNDEAFKCFAKAAEQGHVFAQYHLGLRYLKNETPEDDKKAYDLFVRAANAGCLEAMSSLAECLWYGCGVEENLPEAKKTLTVLAVNGEKGKELVNELAKEEGNSPKEYSLKQFIRQLQRELNLIKAQQHGGGEERRESAPKIQSPAYHFPSLGISALLDTEKSSFCTTDIFDVTRLIDMTLGMEKSASVSRVAAEGKMRSLAHEHISKLSQATARSAKKAKEKNEDKNTQPVKTEDTQKGWGPSIFSRSASPSSSESSGVTTSSPSSKAISKESQEAPNIPLDSGVAPSTTSTSSSSKTS